MGTSLVAQWLRIRLPTQGMRLRSLVRELDPTCMPQRRIRMPQLRPGTTKKKKKKKDGKLVLGRHHSVLERDGLRK